MISILFPLFLFGKRSWTEITFSQNLFRCPTPSKMTRFEKRLIHAHFQISHLLTK
ncbi:hypothetical protein B8W97_00075 [Staphylococcus haemolyticus]|nr:hypothetical protein B8W97_00075 [Staphylococcus haemolyticus]